MQAYSTYKLDYYPFGMVMPGRSFTSESYRFGFQGQEKNDDLTDVDGGHLDFKYRIHDARLGRFLSVDPLMHSFPWNSPYAFAENMVIAYIDFEGAEKFYAADGKFIGAVGDDLSIRILTDQALWEEYTSTMVDGSHGAGWDNYYISELNLEKGSYAFSFNDLVKLQLSNNLEAEVIDAVIRQYLLDKISDKYTIAFDSKINEGIFITSDGTAGNKVISMNPSSVKYFDSNFQSTLIIAIAHEIIHVYQRTVQGITSHDEREFLAYHFSLNPNNSVLQEFAKNDPNYSEEDIVVFNEADDANKVTWVKKAEGYYNKLSTKKQNKYADLKKDIDKNKKELQDKGYTF